MATRLSLRHDPAPQNIAEVGNAAAASIPVLLAQAALDDTLKPGHRVLLTAIGGGHTWGAATLTWPELDVHDTGGLDSLAVGELSMVLSQHHGIEITDNEPFELDTVAELVALMEQGKRTAA